MFWGREKTVRVELVNPEIRVQAEQRPEPKPEVPRAELPAPAQNESKDFILKLVALLSVAIQSLLAIYGYSALAGNYETFGISMSELEVGLPTLLFQGYLFILMQTVVSAPHGPGLGLGLMALVFMLIAGLIISWIRPASSRVDKLEATITLGGLLFILFVIPVIGATSGQSLALKDLIESGLPSSSSITLLDRVHVIRTDQGEKQGMVVAATTNYTFLLVGTEVLKIDNKGNKVVRVTKLSAKSTPADATQS